MATHIGLEYLRKLPPLPDTTAYTEMAATFQELQNTDRAYALAAAYRMGQALDDAFSEDLDVYGEKPVERLAACAGVAPDELDRLYTLCCVFDSEFMEKCQQRKTAKGNLISLPHLHALAEVRDPLKRHELLAETYAKDLTVEDLRALIQADAEVIKVRHWRPAESDPPTPLLVAMELTRVMMKLSKGLEVWDDELLETIKEDSQNRLYTILLNRFQEALASLAPNLCQLMNIENELSAASDYLLANRRTPQDPDPETQWCPKPKA